MATIGKLDDNENAIGWQRLVSWITWYKVYIISVLCPHMLVRVCEWCVCVCVCVCGVRCVPSCVIMRVCVVCLCVV